MKTAKASANSIDRQGMKAINNVIKLVVIVAATALATAVVPVVATAAPALEVSSTSTAVVPGDKSFFEVDVTNVGDTATSGPITVTSTLPAGITATSAVGRLGGLTTIWSCTVSAGGQVVTCTGPAFSLTLPAGQDVCTGNSLGSTCPIRIQITAGATKGEFAPQTRACGGGASACSPDDPGRVVVEDFGNSFGIAPINTPGADTVPALPGYDKAFWAGACDRTAAPPWGDAVPAPGIGALPSMIWAPNGETANPADNRVQVAPPSSVTHCIDVGEPTQYRTAEPGIWFEAPDWRLPPLTQAGSRPDGSSTMAFKRDASNVVDGAVDNIVVDLPPGFVGNPNAIDECTQEEFAAEPPQCSPASQAGVLQLLIEARGFGAAGHGAQANYMVYPVWNLEPRQGRVAELGFAYASGERAVSVRLTAKARTSGDFGVTAFTGQVPAALSPIMQTITLWGVPWDSLNDTWRAPRGMDADQVSPADPCAVQPGVTGIVGFYIPPSGLTVAGCAQSYDPSWGPVRPFLSQETDCNASPVVKGWTDSYQDPGAWTVDGDPDPGDPDWKTATSPQAAVTGCEKLGFSPDIEFAPTTSSADGSTGLKVDLSVPQNNDLPFDPPPAGASQGQVDDYVDQAAAYWKSDAGLATAHLKDTVVKLPAGMSVNPSAATGLTGCDDATVGVRQQGNPPLFNNADPSDGLDGDDCPDGSRIGTARVDTPLLDDPLTGEVILGTPKSTNPTSGEMLRMFLVLRDKDRGLIAKVYGSAVADPGTGQLTATFKNNPEIPFDNLELEFKGGPKGVLAMPQACGNPGWTTAFTPWSAVGAATPVADRQDGGAFAVNQNCANRFAPSLAAGMDTQAARSNGSFSFRFARSEGDQYLRGLTATLPKGLLASVKDLPLCSNAAANAGACPAGSKIGIVDAKAGSGDPFVLEEKGEVFLTDGYKGGEYGLAVKIRPIAGPFRGAMELSPIIVRQAIHVDRKTAQVTAVSDPFPLIHHGVPLRVREVTVLVNRGGFMLNPSDCEAKQVGASIVSDQGAMSNAVNPFRASGCADLAFKPKLALRLTGRKQVRTGKHPGIRAVVTQKGVPEAGIEKAEVRLPKSLALDVDNAQALCEFEDGTKPDLENHCPKGSIVGRARAKTPLLNRDLVGNVYFVKNVRRSSSGNLIRTLPMIVVALRGEIAVNLVGESNVKKGKLVNTFDEVPDAPITKFNLNIKGGKRGIIAVTRTRRSLINLCAKPKRHIAEADIDGHNGKRHDTDIRMKTPCGKKSRKTKAQKRKAAKRKAAAKRRAARA